MDKEKTIGLLKSVFMDDTDTINPAFDDRVESVTQLQEAIVGAAEEIGDLTAVNADLSERLNHANTELNRKRLELLDLKDPNAVKNNDNTDDYAAALDALDGQVEGAE